MSPLNNNNVDRCISNPCNGGCRSGVRIRESRVDKLWLIGTVPPPLSFPSLPLSWLHHTAILFLWSCECIALACGKITPAQTLFFPNPPAEFSLLIKKLIMARAGRPFFKARRNAIWPPPNADVIIDRRGRDCVPYGFLTQPRLEHLAVDVSELATHFHFISLYSKCRT